MRVHKSKYNSDTLYKVYHEMFFDRYASTVYEFGCTTLFDVVEYLKDYPASHIAVFYQNVKHNKWEEIYDSWESKMKKVYEPEDPEFAYDRFDTDFKFEEYELKEEYPNKYKIVIVEEWCGYIGNNPNKSYEIGRLIEIAKTQQAGWEFIGSTIEPGDCFNSKTYPCRRKGFLTFRKEAKLKSEE